MIAIEALVLAAGESRRMKRDKLLLDLGGKTVIEKALDNIMASQIRKTTVIVRPAQEKLRQVLSAYNVEILENPNYQEGMSASIKVGVHALTKKKTTKAVLIFNGDMPFIKPGTINAILAAYESTGAFIIAPKYQGRRGQPVLFDRQLFAELFGLSGDIGGRKLFEKYSHNVMDIEAEDSGVHYDIDIPEDYQLAFRQIKAVSGGTADEDVVQ